MLFRRLRATPCYCPAVQQQSLSSSSLISSCGTSLLMKNTSGTNQNKTSLAASATLLQSRVFNSSSASTTATKTPEQQQQQSFVTPTVYGEGDAFGTIIRQVHPRGFVSPLDDTLFWSTETRKSEEFKTARKLAVDKHKNVLLTGPANTGKRTVLVELMEDLKDHHWKQYQKETASNNNTSAVDKNTFDRKFALISLKINRSFTMPNALSALGFLGLRHIFSSTPAEQVASALHRHIRLIKSAYGSCITTLKDVEVLAIDSMEDMHPNLFKALDNVCRELKNEPDTPFGGIQIIATANFWRMSDIDQSSPHGLYTYQLEGFNQLFPSSQTLLMHRFVHRTKIEGIDKDDSIAKLDDYTINSLFGNLPENINEFERLFSQKSLPYALPLDSSSSSSADPTSASSMNTNNNNSNGGGGDKINLLAQQLHTCEFRDYSECVYEMFPSFARHVMKRERAGSFKNSGFKKLSTRFVSWLSSLLVLPWMAGGALGLTNKLNLKVDDVVVFTRDLHDLDLVRENEEDQQQQDNKNNDAHQNSPNSYIDELPSTKFFSSNTIVVPKGSLGTIVEVGEHRMKVQLWKGDRNVVTVLPMRISCYHSSYPNTRESVTQFPLLTLKKVYPDALVMLNIPVEAVIADARFFTEVNELGNVLAVLNRPSLHFLCMREFLERPACVHEATKNYYEGLIEQKDLGGRFGTMPHRNDLPTKLCRNCKTHVNADDFREHWLSCIHSCRWCPECSTTVPLEKWDAHNEKHTVVMCLDCGKPLEWRNWALHRNTCGAMIREVSANNEFLPSVTQQTALQMGVDGRDLHSVKQINKAALPKTGRDVSKTHKTSFQYKATGMGF